jgi:hypothetical protein
LPVDEALITFPLPTVDAFKALLLLALLKTAILAGFPFTLVAVRPVPELLLA